MLGAKSSTQAVIACLVISHASFKWNCCIVTLAFCGIRLCSPGFCSAWIFFNCMASVAIVPIVVAMLLCASLTLACYADHSFTFRLKSTCRVATIIMSMSSNCRPTSCTSRASKKPTPITYPANRVCMSA